MDSSLLVRIFGFRATLVHGDTLVLDRWRWLKKRLPRTCDQPLLLDVGCGTGGFTIGAALRGYDATGLSWDIRNQTIARERAAFCGAGSVRFPIQDVRNLGDRSEYFGKFDIVVCTENIEHILDDLTLMGDIHKCLRPGGMLLLTTPNYFYKAISNGDVGPFVEDESGGHVRRGYHRSMLVELCAQSGFFVEEISSCSGLLSQKITWLWRSLNHFPILGFLLTFPLRILPPMIDPILRKITGWPDYCICMIAYKPRFAQQKDDERRERQTHELNHDTAHTIAQAPTHS
jgi:2-polyprenyl-3-methyl-5-hydroxy-6-metoxy-1,4-benzoquinol methylase